MRINNKAIQPKSEDLTRTVNESLKIRKAAIRAAEILRVVNNFSGVELMTIEGKTPEIVRKALEVYGVHVERGNDPEIIVIDTQNPEQLKELEVILEDLIKNSITHSENWDVLEFLSILRLTKENGFNVVIGSDIFRIKR